MNTSALLLAFAIVLAALIVGLLIHGALSRIAFAIEEAAALDEVHSIGDVSSFLERMEAGTTEPGART